jgi:hypothetical protein
VSDITVLTNFRKITSLNIAKTPVSDITALRDMTELDSLLMSDSKVADISPISRLNLVQGNPKSIISFISFDNIPATLRDPKLEGP